MPPATDNVANPNRDAALEMAIALGAGAVSSLADRFWRHVAVAGLFGADSPRRSDGEPQPWWAEAERLLAAIVDGDLRLVCEGGLVDPTLFSSRWTAAGLRAYLCQHDVMPPGYVRWPFYLAVSGDFSGWEKRYREPAARPGRPPALSAADDADIIAAIKAGDYATKGAVAKELRAEPFGLPDTTARDNAARLWKIARGK